MTTSAYFIACDDIRHEASGKEILIGVYGDDIIVNSFPASLEHLYFRINVRSPIDERHIVRSVRVERPGLENFEQEFPKKDSIRNRPESDEAVRFFDTYLKFDIGPLTLPKSGRIRVFVETESEEIYAGSLRVVEATEVAPISPRDLVAALGAVNLFARSELLSREDSSKLAVETLTALSKSPIGHVLIEKPDHVIIGIGDNKFRVLGVGREFTEGSIQITDVPEGYTWEIVERDQFGGVISFSPSEPPIRQFSLHLESGNGETED